MTTPPLRLKISFDFKDVQKDSDAVSIMAPTATSATMAMARFSVESPRRKNLGLRIATTRKTATIASITTPPGSTNDD